MPLYAIGEHEPTIDGSAFIHPDAVIIGQVSVGPEATVWPGTVLRGDHGKISVGAATSVQDGTVVHCTSGLDTIIGQRCVIGHRAHLEGCVIEDDCLIGSGSVVLHRVIVRSGSLVGAQALVTNDTVIPERSLALGVPAKIKVGVVPKGAHDDAVQMYVRNAHWYNADLRRLD